ncbi:hypothetical protein [Nocardioides sp. Soil805]|uniref:hypothetical protein n=1 Tax=Nocardioides sp. Soil805 TaxID=1736416 RepID=UPI000702B9A3|nr:hypothetical protein [Nocardioides sp. Soil805]KRF37210.1 hypothetical protein ASG94_07645 [Nocardioides sp. Soil805]
MRFTEHELTLALTAAAKPVAAAQRRGGLRRSRLDPDVVWTELSGYERYQVLDALGGQLLPALVALPDVEVETGARPVFTDAQVSAAVEETLGDVPGGRVRRKVVVAARVALVRAALAGLPPRSDPDTLQVPDSL